MKKILNTILLLATVMSLSACGKPNKPVDPRTRVDVSAEKTWIVDGVDTYVQYLVEEGKEKPFDRYKKNYWYVDNEAQWICDYVDGKLEYPIINYVSMVDDRYIEKEKYEVEHGHVLENLPDPEDPKYFEYKYYFNEEEIDVTSFKIYKDLTIERKSIAKNVAVDIDTLNNENYKTRTTPYYQSEFYGKAIKVIGTVLNDSFYGFTLANVIDGRVRSTILVNDLNNVIKVHKNDYIELTGKMAQSGPFRGLEFDVNRSSKLNIIAPASQNKDHSVTTNTKSINEMVKFFNEGFEKNHGQEHSFVSISDTLTIDNVSALSEDKFNTSQIIKVSNASAGKITSFVLMTNLDTVNKMNLKVGDKLKVNNGMIFFYNDTDPLNYLWFYEDDISKI